ncbi:MAG: hypothetical protein KDJ77_05240 [Rhodobiaceae bacterium]|nr:hypothetical protein [Rhodobiaceae bacterium]
MSGFEKVNRSEYEPDIKSFDDDAAARLFAIRNAVPHADALLLIRRTFPDIPVARRITPNANFHLRPRRP